MTSSVLTIGLIDEKFCPMEAINYAESAGVSNVKTIAIQPQSPNHLNEAIEEAEKCDVIILDCKLFLDDDSYPCFICIKERFLHPLFRGLEKFSFLRFQRKGTSYS